MARRTSANHQSRHFHICGGRGRLLCCGHTFRGRCLADFVSDCLLFIARRRIVGAADRRFTPTFEAVRILWRDFRGAGRYWNLRHLDADAKVVDPFRRFGSGCPMDTGNRKASLHGAGMLSWQAGGKCRILYMRNPPQQPIVACMQIHGIHSPTAAFRAIIFHCTEFADRVSSVDAVASSGGGRTDYRTLFHIDWNGAFCGRSMARRTADTSFLAANGISMALHLICAHCFFDLVRARTHDSGNSAGVGRMVPSCDSRGNRTSLCFCHEHGFSQFKPAVFPTVRIAFSMKKNHRKEVHSVNEKTVLRRNKL